MNALGVDISTWQDSPSIPGHVDFDKMRLAGVSFIFIKASQATRTDADFVRNWAGAQAAGILRGAYHYMDWTKPALEQARYFAALVQADRGELPPVLDYECRTSPPSAGTARLYCRAFLEELQALLGVVPILYTSPGYWAERGSADAYWKRYPLWLAHYTTGKPVIPKPWTEWTFWQYSDHGDGYKYGVESREIDMDTFNGDDDTLLKFAGGVIQPPPPLPWAESITAWARTVNPPYIGVDPD